MAGGKIQKGMGTEELNALRCGTCNERRMGNDGQMVCKITEFPTDKHQSACISHSKLNEIIMQKQV